VTTAPNQYGTPVTTDPEVCMACVLAKMLETGVMSGAVDAGHSGCEGTRQKPCTCGCEYSLQKQCKECSRKGQVLDDGGQCVDRRDCANTILAHAANRRAEEVKRKAAAPPKRTGGRTASSPRDCTCGCGEKTGGGLYRPGHDARHVSALVNQYKVGSIDRDKALKALEHSDKLQAKFDKATGAS